jgi:Fe-S-cluster-containing hydrogenase component 2
MTEDIYRKLAHHLDKLPCGFPATEDGLELRILKRLFTPEEAELAIHLNLIAEPAPVIARRAGLSVDEAQQRLDEMASKGLIYDIRESGKPPMYMGFHFIVGIWEFQVNRLNMDLIRDVDEYLERSFFNPRIWKENPQLRTIPIGESIPNPTEIMAYEQAEKLIQANERFAVADCICRKEKQMAGEGCNKPLETCLVMGQGAEYYERHRMGRPIDKAEALALLGLANEHGLVIQPANSKDAGYMCFCCGDCCGVLRSVKRYPQPGTLVSSPYLAVSDEEICSACETCVERCQMDAIQVNGYAQVLQERCIGCGLCVTTCETGAMHLERKPEYEQPYIPKDNVENFLRMARQRGTIKTPDLVMMAIRSKIDRLLAMR